MNTAWLSPNEFLSLSTLRHGLPGLRLGFDGPRFPLHSFHARQGRMPVPQGQVYRWTPIRIIHLCSSVCIRGQNYLSVNAATPGNSIPARNSSDAPPPVEICEILSATPADFTAF